MDNPFLEVSVKIYGDCGEYRFEIRPDPDGLGGIEIAYQEYDHKEKEWKEKRSSGFIEPEIAVRLGGAIKTVIDGTDKF